LLNATAALTPVYLLWIKAHVGYPGNEKADELAKAGAKQDHLEHSASPRDITPLSFVRSILQEWLQDIWTHWWILTHPCRQTKIWFPIPDSRKSREIMKLDRISQGQLIRWITGHAFLRGHQNLVDPWNFSTPMCRICHIDAETPDHIITSCPRLSEFRDYTFGINNDPTQKWEVRSLTDYLLLIADRLETISTDPIDLYVDQCGSNGRTLLLIEFETLLY
jgi:hypothetical protein